MTDQLALQDALAPKSVCFGCGPANPKGLRIKSRRHGPGLRTLFRPRPEHQAFRDVVNGGILGTLIDCHANWTAAVAIMDARHETELPSTVTAAYEVRLRRPTPMGAELELVSRVRQLALRPGRAEIEVEVRCGAVVTATGSGVFVEVEPGHPAYHRWD